MNIRDKFIDREGFTQPSNQQSDEQFQKAEQFFSLLPEITLEAEKVRCPSCNTLHKLYCLECGKLLVNAALIPQIQLPVDLMIIHHNKEKHQKSSALPAQFLSNNVEIIDYPGQLEFDENTYILYPHQNAKLLKELPQEQLNSIKKIVAIDCTWHQTGAILESIQKVSPQQKFIKLEEYQTHFWRYQHHSLKCLATIEAIYYFYEEYSAAMKLEQSFNELLFFYKLQFQMIKQSLIKEKGNDNVYEKIEQKKKKLVQLKCETKQKKQFQKL